MRRRRALTPIAVVLAALLATGCVTHPVDETALTGRDPELGATPAPSTPPKQSGWRTRLPP